MSVCSLTYFIVYVLKLTGYLSVYTKLYSLMLQIQLYKYTTTHNISEVELTHETIKGRQ